MNLPEHRNIVITGAGSGFGRAIALKYADAGWAVAVTDQDLPRAEAVMQRITEHGGRGFAQRLDITRDDHWQAVTQTVEQRWGGLGVLVNNAGVAVGGNLVQTSIADWQWVIDIDLLGVVRGCKAFAPQFKRQRSGHIVNISSFAGLAGVADIVAYGTAKAGVIALSEALRAEMKPAGVGVSVVCPAFVRTNLTDTMRVPAEAVRMRVRRWMENSGVTADDIAESVFRAVQRNRFMVLTHKNTRWLWRLKRWAPERYFKMLTKIGGSVTRKEVASNG